jgi:peroxiredoxin
VTLLGAVAVVLLATPAERDTPLAVNAHAPAIVLGDQHGRRFELADALAQRDFLVVAFYVKAFTGG